jgi:hypothetical protein
VYACRQTAASLTVGSSIGASVSSQNIYSSSSIKFGVIRVHYMHMSCG